MTRVSRALVISAAAVAVFLADWTLDGTTWPGWIPAAGAVVGMPATPLSVAGVARRTTRRTVAVASTSAAVAASAAQPAPAAAPPPAAPPAPAAGTLPIGTIVNALPAGCAQTTIGGIQYYKCGADYYRTAFQGANLVYVTTQP